MSQTTSDDNGLAFVRENHKHAFLEAANKFKVCIYLRPINKHSFPYMGYPGYTPKPFKCKAKAANFDSGNYKLAGLVASPKIHPKVFKKDINQIIELWNSTILSSKEEFTVETNSANKHYGCLKMNGQFIHSDYDLYAVVDPNAITRNLADVKDHFIGALVPRVMKFVNGKIGTPMIQHGAEEHNPNPVGGEKLLRFSPDGKETIIPEEEFGKLNPGRKRVVPY